MRLYKWTRWLPVLLFLALGFVLCFVLSSHSFLGILSWAVAAVCTLDNLLYLWSRRNLAASKFLRLLLSGVVILVILAGVFTLPGILQGPAQNPEEDSPYLLVLGAGVRGTEPSPILQDRIDRAYTYLTEHPETVCVASGGKGDGENISEAQCIYDGLTDRGIAPERIWMEDQATSTVENFRYSLALIREKTGTKPEKLTVLSNEFHLYRAGIMAADQGVAANFVSAPTTSWSIRLNYTLREIFALWKYLIIGG